MLNFRRIRRWTSLAAAAALAAATFSLIAPPPAHAAPTFPASRWTVQTAANGGRIHLSSPAIADIDGDGVKDVIIGDLNGRLHVYSGASGGEVNGWPPILASLGPSPTGGSASPTSPMTLATSGR